MAIRQYLAMTAAEMAMVPSLPPGPAWMACHFSPYSTGLTNLPGKLPPGCLLILNDRTPIHGHDPQRIGQELEQVLRRFGCTGLLVDFQNPPNEESLALSEYLSQNLNVPMAFPPEYGVQTQAAFLPLVPTDCSLSNYLQKWASREIWLEAALEGQNITLTQQGAAYGINHRQDFPHIHADEKLHCHYSIEEQEASLVFHTWRTPEDLAQLLEEAEQHGITRSIGLYQELAAASGR